ncbi:MarR family winged helix-turn-helix transcriptional regulator [Georgenia faecalis]|uniref:MarR family winged helix-turn-helix transcriptional regulator n=1 Tax=Georgenia faecalis TaxID=2483799 RepID=UPI000FDBFF57|nr:MarR family transcriptional regulator [Georgenia faecalis]
MDEKADLVREVSRLQDEVTRLLARERLAPMLRTTLTIQQLKVLMILRLEGPLGGKDLAGRLDVSMATVSGLVDRLVKRGMLERRAAPADRRVHLVGLSTEGERTVVELESVGERARALILNEMDVEGLRALARGFAAMAEAVEHVAARPERPE